MILREFTSRFFLGNSSIPPKYLHNEPDDYLYLTIDNVSFSSFHNTPNNLYINNHKIKKLELGNETLFYSDLLIFRKNSEFCFCRYANELGNKIIVSGDFIVLRPIGGGFLHNFLTDMDGKLYLKAKLEQLFQQNDYDDFVRKIPEIDIPLLSDLKPSVNKNKLTSVKQLPLDPSKIDVRSEQVAISTIISRMKREAINLFTDFQRLQNLWKIDVKSRFIESLLVRFPVPSFYFDCSDKDKWLVIDGLQRLSTLKQFVIDKTLKLENLEYLPDLEGKCYDDLTISNKSLIDETNITAIKIQAGTPARVKYSLFERINENAVPLKPQEIRHAVNSANDGKPAKYIKELTNEKVFAEIWSNRLKDRMQDREVALCYTAKGLNLSI